MKIKGSAASSRSGQRSSALHLMVRVPSSHKKLNRLSQNDFSQSNSNLPSCFKSTQRLPINDVFLSGGRSPESKDLRIIVYLCSEIGAKILRLATLAQEDTQFSIVAVSNQQLDKPEFNDENGKIRRCLPCARTFETAPLMYLSAYFDRNI